MKKLIQLVVIMVLLSCGSTNAQVLRPFTARYYNPSAKGSIVYVSNSIVSTSGVNSGVPGTGEIAPSGSSTNNDNPGVNIDIDGPFPTTIFPLGSTWKYRANNTRYTNWHTSGYNDGAWTNGTAEFGYGDGDETTCVTSGGGGTICLPTGNKYITTYFRKTINIPNRALYSNFTMGVLRDDGVVVYVNGTEVYRNNMPLGTIAHATLANGAASDDGTTLQEVTLPITAFVNGNNVIAVEVHQSDATSSDLSFDMQLLGEPLAITTLLPLNSTWKYLANNTRPATWNTTGYADGAWPTGNGRLGYGQGTETTCVPSGGGGTLCDPTGAKYITTYFRKTISIPNPSLYSYISMGMYRDDGIIVYVNGTEVYRDNMPTGTPLHSTLASGAAGDDGAALMMVNIPISSFIAGNNVIAVEIHQNDANSTDLTFDMEILGSTDATFNCSSANLTLPTCSNILFAGLYWGAGQGNSGSNTGWIRGETTCQLKLPGASVYTTISSAQTDYWDNTVIAGYAHTGYQCFTDITSLLNATNPNGTYTIANVASPTGIKDAYGGWTIVIVYGNPTLLPRNLTVFDGNAGIKGGGAIVDIPIAGFLTPPAGAVSCELGAVVFDGDRTSADAFSFKQASSGTYFDLTPTATNPTSNLNDMWNSVIAYKGAVVTTRNPSFQNTLGYDANIINLPNTSNAQLSNAQTSATVRFSSPSENYIVTVLTTAISQYNPTFAFHKTATDINGGSVVPGDSLRYVINYNNVGNDASTNTIVVDNIPVGATYLPGSLRINGVAKTDVSADDQAEYDMTNNRVVFRIGTGANATSGGSIASGAAAGTVQFDVITASSCKVYSCIGSIRNTARINYTGLTSGASLYDSSGVNISGCITPGAVVYTPIASCFTPGDTLLVNKCPASSLLIPWRKYPGYQIYSAQPFIPANLYNPATPVTTTHTYWAFFSNGAGCSDTIKINMIITRCPDIDDDNDGIPDYIEFNDPRATQNHDGDALPNWNDNNYSPWNDTNSDGVNDNFDWGADSDNDGIINFRDHTFWIAWVDINGDDINDKADRDLDGIPNQYDLDSDNDGIPDVVEAYGVDAYGDGIIDNYTDSDNDGFSQNVDSTSSGVTGSKSGLGIPDLDGDALPNYLDTDSDNDGIPDVLEAGGTDVDNDGYIDGFIDTDGDGLSDQADGDVGNDGTAENASNALLRTGPDAVTPFNGRAESYPYKNMDNDGRANPYDLDSDGDGIIDAVEAGFTDANFDGFIDGARGIDGWNTAVNNTPSLILRNTDGRGNPDYLDIDADDDGIPDNIEGQTTASYKFPVYADSDNDGIDNNYEASSGSFGGSGIFLSDKDGDGLPDYRDLDTDSDGQLDIVEGNDFNRNGIFDENVTLTLLDDDNDGLDNRFDSIPNSTSNIRGTSYNMGTGGSTSGDAAPGAKCPVQKTNAVQPDRDWRYVGYVLPVQLITFNGSSQISNVVLSWSIITPVNIDRFEVERSTDNMMFEKVGSVAGNVSLNELHQFTADDNISTVKSSVIYYRLRIIATNGQIKFSNVLLIRKNGNKTEVIIQPNPAANNTSIHFYAEKESEVTIRLLDAVGKTVYSHKQKVFKGNNVVQLNELSKLNNAVYSVQIVINDEIVTKKLIVQNR